MKPTRRRRSATRTLGSRRRSDLRAAGVVEAVRRAQQALAEDLLDLADLRAAVVRDVVAGARVEALARLEAHELDALGLVRVEADVLLEVEARLLDEAHRLAGLA